MCPISWYIQQQEKLNTIYHPAHVGLPQLFKEVCFLLFSFPLQPSHLWLKAGEREVSGIQHADFHFLCPSCFSEPRPSTFNCCNFCLPTPGGSLFVLLSHSSQTCFALGWLGHSPVLHRVHLTPRAMVLSSVLLLPLARCSRGSSMSTPGYFLVQDLIWLHHALLHICRPLLWYGEFFKREQGPGNFFLGSDAKPWGHAWFFLVFYKPSTVTESEIGWPITSASSAVVCVTIVIWMINCPLLLFS